MTASPVTQANRNAAAPVEQPSTAAPERQDAIALLELEWATAERWAGINRTFSAADVVSLRGRVVEEHTLARLGAEKLWSMLHRNTFTRALGALTGNQAVQMVRGGLKSIYLSGWQVAADANLSGQTYPDQSLYPANSVPAVVRRINNALMRADQIDHSNRKNDIDFMVPIVADAEAGFGGPLNAFELMKSMIAAGAAAVHWEDQLASEKKCGHLGGKVLIPTAAHIRTLNAARLAADLAGIPTLIVARTDALAADLLTSDVDPIDAQFTTGERTSEGFFRIRNGIEPVLARAKAYAPYSDLIWVETGTLDLGLAREFATNSTMSSRARSWHTTALRRSTGEQRSPRARSLLSRTNWATSATPSSSSRWPDSMR
jgi:isocitrate lyase